MKKIFISSSIAVAILFVGCTSNNSTKTTTPPSGIPVPSTVLGTQGSLYTISVFAQTTSVEPDDIVEAGGDVWVVCQDPNINPDGTLPPGVTKAQSTLIQYDLTGKVLQTLNLPGHPDGIVLFNPTTLWVSSNEDGNSVITSVDTTSGAMQSYTADVAVLPHGGGIDDLKVINSVVYASASSPTTSLTPSPNLGPYSTDGSGATAIYGVNTGPALYAISLNADGVTFHSTPALMSSTPTNLLPGTNPVTLNMTDADSSFLDASGNLVMVSQQDSELVFIQNLGASTQATNVLPLTLYGNPWPVDDTRLSPASGTSYMLLTDPPAKLIYKISATGGFQPNTAFSAGQGSMLITDMTSGNMTPIYVGMNNPHGLIFVPTTSN